MADEGAEFSGRTVEDAITQAERQLGSSRTNLDIEIITTGRSGVFGIGAEAARIRARLPLPVASAVIDVAPPSSPLEESPVSPAMSTDSSEEMYVREEGDEDEFEDDEHLNSPVAMEQTGDLPNEAAEVLRTLLRSMGFDVEVAVRSTENPIMLVITGTNLGVLIGRRGDNLAALQFMVNLILSKNRRQWPRIVIDVENYRARREESLRSLADRIAYRVRRNQRPFTLEAMPAGDRRVIHLSLREQEDIETYSIGEGISRRVVIAPRRGAPPPPRVS